MNEELNKLSIQISDLPISIRTYNSLRRGNIHTLREILRAGPRQLLHLKAFGLKCLVELAEILEGVLGSVNKAELLSVITEVNAWRPFFENPENISLFAERSNEDGRITKAKKLLTFTPKESIMAYLPVGDMPLSTRAQNILLKNGISNVHQLVGARPQEILDSTNCGIKTLLELSCLVEGYVESLPPGGKFFYGESYSDWKRQFRRHLLKIRNKDDGKPEISRYVADVLNRSNTPSLMEVIDESLEGMSPRDRALLVKRMGLLKGKSRKTLEAVGRDADLTRERVRQIVDRSIDRCVKTVRARRPELGNLLLQYLHRQKVATTDDLMRQIMNVGDSQNYDASACTQMLIPSFSEEVKPLVSSNCLWSVSKNYTADTLKEVIKTAKKVLWGIPQKLDLVALEVARILHQTEDEHLEVIKKMLRTPSSALQVEITPEGEMVVPPYQNVADQRKSFLHDYIREQGVPVHIKELFTALQDSAPELIPDSPTRISANNTIASAIERDHRFSWAGSSTWGLTEWGYLTQERSFRAVVLALLRSSDEHLSTTQITKVLSNLYRLSSSCVPAVLRADEARLFRKDSEGKWYAIG